MLINADCLLGMQKVPDKNINCVITDLPYNVLVKDGII